MTQPSYLTLLKNGILEARTQTLKRMLENCVLCPHQCQVNRLAGERGYCQTLDNVVIASASAHFGEEAELVGDHGSGTIFFSHCNLKCVFCQNYEISTCGEGEEITSGELAGIMLHLQKRKCHNINLVSPGHVIPQIVEAIFIAAQKGLNIPIVYNTNAYDLTDTLRLLDGIIDIYMPDLKFADDEAGRKYLGVKKYATIAKSAIKEMYRQVGDLLTDEQRIAERGLLIRHLVMPANLAGTDEILSWIATELSKDTYVNLMAQYYPANRAAEYPELSRRVTHEEYLQALKMARDLGLTWLQGRY